VARESLTGHAHEKLTPIAQSVREAYARGEEDELLQPLIASDERGEPFGRIEKEDCVFFFDIRGEREIELTRSFTEDRFGKFPVMKGLNLHFLTMIEYAKSLNVRVAFPPEEDIQNTLCSVVSQNGLKHAKIAETEKSVHVTYFLNGKSNEHLPGEKRILIHSLKDVRTIDERPEMRAVDVAQAAMRAAEDQALSLIIVNFANVDVVGHLENAEAIRKAVETVDTCLGMVLEKNRRLGLVTMVTADHGTVERWLYPDGTIDTGHTNSPVPFVLVEADQMLRGERTELRMKGTLADIAPTVLQVMGLKKPEIMSGKSLMINSPYASTSTARVMLIILDGWGHSDETHGNLIRSSDTPTMDSITSRFPTTLLVASGEAVGMPPGTVGNSEVGHLHIGAGRKICSDRVKIDSSIMDGSFFQNKEIKALIRRAKETGRHLHLLGIVSFYSSHGSVEHLRALLKLVKHMGLKGVHIHAILGRRGERPESGARYVEDVEREATELGIGHVVTVIGRHWALDREENWDRIEKTYRALVYGVGRKVKI
jgi:2,3-bisphosphoglycerate-independent phosphoglycerate mutase